MNIINFRNDQQSEASNVQQNEQSNDLPLINIESASSSSDHEIEKNKKVVEIQTKKVQYNRTRKVSYIDKNKKNKSLLEIILSKPRNKIDS